MGRLGSVFNCISFCVVELPPGRITAKCGSVSLGPLFFPGGLVDFCESRSKVAILLEGPCTGVKKKVEISRQASSLNEEKKKR